MITTKMARRRSRQKQPIEETDLPQTTVHHQQQQRKCWEKYIKGKYIYGLPMHAERAHYVVCRKKCVLLYVHISHVNSLASIDPYVWTFKTFNGILLSEWRDIEGIYNMSTGVLWHFITRSYKCKEHPLMGEYSRVELRIMILYDTIEGKTVVMGNLSCLSLLLFLSI